MWIYWYFSFVIFYYFDGYFGSIGVEGFMSICKIRLEVWL